MNIKRITSMFFSCLIAVSMLALPASAATALRSIPAECIAPYATNSFNIAVPAKTNAKADATFSMAAGESISLSVTYAPFYADIDVGFIAPDGDYIYVNSTSGAIEETLSIGQSGRYTLMVRNNSSVDVNVTGVINY